MNVGAALVPRALAMALAKVPMENVGSVAPVPEEEDMVVVSGQTSLTGEAMPAARAMAIRRRIVEDAAPGLGYEWWRDLFAPLRVAAAPSPPLVRGFGAGGAAATR